MTEINNTNINDIDLNDPKLFEKKIADESSSEHLAAPKYSYWGSVWRNFFHNKFDVFVAFHSK